MNHLSLFTGSGIGDYAAEQCGIRTVAQCECEPACCYCLERMFPRSQLFRDVRDVTVSALRERIEIISGGFPCQDISTAGKGAGLSGERSGLWFEMRRVVDEIKPAWVLAENVPALRVRGADRVLADLEELGYTCWPCVVGAEEAGLRHRRKRVWIVAYSGSERHARVQSNAGICSPSQKTRVASPEPLALPGWARGLGGISEVPFHDDGMAGSVLRQTRDALLRMVGNGWVYPISLMLYRWIVEQNNSTR